jgi:hypothetical protein
MKSNKTITAAGILLIAGGVLNGIYWLLLMGGGSLYLILVICVLILLAVTGGICTLRKKLWGLALIAAIFCSIFGIIALFIMPFFPPMHAYTFIKYIAGQICGVLITLAGLIAVILLALKKGDFKADKN